MTDFLWHSSFHKNEGCSRRWWRRKYGVFGGYQGRSGAYLLLLLENRPHSVVLQRDGGRGEADGRRGHEDFRLHKIYADAVRHNVMISPGRQGCQECHEVETIPSESLLGRSEGIRWSLWAFPLQGSLDANSVMMSLNK